MTDETQSLGLAVRTDQMMRSDQQRADHRGSRSLLFHPAGDLLPESTPESISNIQDDAERDDRGTTWRRMKGWRFGVSCAAAGCLAVLVTNLVVATVAASSWESEDGIYTVHEGTCNIVDRWSIALHGLINILGSLLFAGSNYTNQYLSSPTRKEVEEAHTKRHWLEIGLPSFSNISGRVSSRRSTLWVLLALTSIPIHLVYNSVIFKTLAASQYDVLVASENFLQASNIDVDIDRWCNSTYVEDLDCYAWRGATDYGSVEKWCSGLGISSDDCQCRNPNRDDIEWKKSYETHCQSLGDAGFTKQCLIYDAEKVLKACRSKYRSRILGYQSLHTDALANSSPIRVQNLSTEQCLSEYDRRFLDTRGPLILITRDDEGETFTSYNTTSGYLNSGQVPSWMCGDGSKCSIDSLRKNSDHWRLFNRNIDYCLSMQVPPRCRLQLSMHILVVVVICNAVKFIVMVLTLTFSEPTLVTIGDAIASFLTTPDPHSMNESQMGRHDLLYSTAPALCFGFKRPPSGRHPLLLKQRWSAAVTQDRWIVTLFLWITLLGTALGLLARAVLTIQHKSTAGSFSRGFGVLDTDATFSFHGQSGIGDAPAEGVLTVIGTILIVNTPQVLATFVYFTYNAHLTAMVTAAEWSSFYLRHKPLRVSEPHGQQRSTYFLQLPFRYSLPLLFAGMALHWLISQSLFLARVYEVRYNPDGTFTNTETVTQVGFSCTPLLLAILLGSFLLFGIVGLGLRSLGGHMPIVGSCSLAIAAACHRPKSDGEAATLSVAWGEVVHSENENDGQCCFTSKEVRAPDGLPRQLNRKFRQHERFKAIGKGLPARLSSDIELVKLVPSSA